MYLDGEYPSLVPLAVGADGNCLFRAASLLSHGDERHHGELRPHVTGELREHSSFYFDDFVRGAEMQGTTDKFLSLASLLSQTLSKAASNTFLMSLSVGLTLSDAFVRGIEHQCSLSTHLGTWASILELAELASTLNRSIQAIYPKKFGLLTQNYMNTIYHPRQSTPSVDEATTCSGNHYVVLHPNCMAWFITTS